MIDLFSQPEPAKASGPYFNTTSERGTTLTLYRTKAAAQDLRILAIMSDIGVASPSQVWKAMGESCPITSCRRALTNLTNAGKLVKTDRKMMSPWDRPEHFWQIVVTLKP